MRERHTIRQEQHGEANCQMFRSLARSRGRGERPTLICRVVLNRQLDWPRVTQVFCVVRERIVRSLRQAETVDSSNRWGAVRRMRPVGCNSFAVISSRSTRPAQSPRHNARRGLSLPPLHHMAALRMPPRSGSAALNRKSGRRPSPHHTDLPTPLYQM